MNPYDQHDRIEKLRRQATEVRERYSTITFSKILKIDRAQIHAGESWRAFEIADSVWGKWRRPDDRARLLDCLSEVINTCNHLGIPYPAIFLLRQKQLLDGDFLPHRAALPLLESEVRE